MRTFPSRAKRGATNPACFIALAATLLANATAPARAADEPVPVVITAKGCEQMELKVPAGKVTFVIANKSTRALEWEILQGVMVIDERENIAPGFKARLTTKLEPGVYEVTCGLLDNPRGRLIVTGAATAVTATELATPVAEYRVGNAQILADLNSSLQRLEAAGADRPAARSAFLEVRGSVAALSPIRSDVGEPARALETDLAALERILFAEGAGEVDPALAKLKTSARDFAAAARPVVAPANRLVAGAVALARDLPNKIASANSAAALSSVEAERAAIERVALLFKPLWARSDPANADAAAAALARLQKELAGADALSPEGRQKQTLTANDLAERLARMPAGLGL
jgi:iron uptake system EfeUOB component EfeO/EfeM